jgi:hypothetical protein
MLNPNKRALNGPNALLDPLLTLFFPAPESMPLVDTNANMKGNAI